MNTMRYLCSLFGASTDDLVTAETPAGLISGLEPVTSCFHFQFQNALISKGIISNRQAEKTESSFHTQDFPPDLD